MKNWKTTAAGVGAILSAVGDFLYNSFDDDPTTNADMKVLTALVLVGVGLIFGKDFNKE